MNRRLVATLIAPLVVAGCGIGAMFAPAPDDLSSWQATPLPPDPGLSDKASHHPSCRPDIQEGAPMEIVLQDRRTASTAAFIVKGPTTIGSCYVSPTGGGGGSQPAAQLAPLGQPFAIDEEGFGGADVGSLAYLGGRLGAQVRQVTIEVPGQPNVTASVGNGYWLAWWPGEARASRVDGFDVAGNRVFSLVFSNGWAAE